MVDSVRNFSYILADSAYDTSDTYDYVFENTHALPKKVQTKLAVNEEDIMGFYEEDGKIVLKKME